MQCSINNLLKIDFTMHCSINLSQTLFVPLPFNPMLLTKYDDIDPYASIFTHKQILSMTKKGQPPKKRVDRRKTLSPTDAMDVYKICNRDLIYGSKLERVELGSRYEVGVVAKDRHRTRSRIERQIFNKKRF